MKDRLLQFLNKNKISATHLADEIGVQRSSVSHVLSGRNNPSYDFIHKILKKYDDLSADWLISGKGEMFSAPKQAQVVSKGTTKQPDLFSNVQESSNKRDDVKDSREKEASSEQKLIDLPEKLPDSDKKLRKVILFYDDGSFQEYNPSS